MHKTKRATIICFALLQSLVMMGQLLAIRLRELLGHGGSRVHHHAQPNDLSGSGWPAAVRHFGEVAAQALSLNFGVGITVPFYSRLRESGYNKTYMRMYDHVKPFVKLQLKYSIR